MVLWPLAERVVLPLDLLSYAPAVHKAVQRAFGGYVLAADSGTAAELAQRHGLASITPDGTVSRRGSLRGGGDGAAATAAGGTPTGPEGVLQCKLELQRLTVSGLGTAELTGEGFKLAGGSD